MVVITRIGDDGLFMAGALGPVWLWYVGLGTTMYGVLYFIAHDGLVHQRWPFRIVPKGGYMQRLYQAHRRWKELADLLAAKLKADLKSKSHLRVRDPDDVPELQVR